jgi:hypothetical protein
MKSSQRLHSSKVVRAVQSILLVAAVMALALLLADRYQQRKAPVAPGTERTAPTDRSHLIDALV